MDLLGATYSGELDRYIPDLGPKRNCTAADSVLHLFNDNKKRQGTAAGRMNNGKTTNLSGAAL